MPLDTYPDVGASPVGASDTVARAAARAVAQRACPGRPDRQRQPIAHRALPSAAPPRAVTRGHRLPAATRCAARPVSHIAGVTAPDPLINPFISVKVGRGGITCAENGREEQARRPPSLNQSGAEQKSKVPAAPPADLI